jgi:hypothetical protein
MDIISFGLGIGSVVFITSVVITVLSFVKLEKLNKRIKEIEVYINTSIECIYSSINTNSELDNRRIDGEIDRTNRVVDDIYRTIDSRLDKLEVKLTDSNKGNKLIKG